jgi:hypothetical protein
MITYELAKELKEAGFPQGEGSYFVDGDLWDRTMQSDYETPSTPRREKWIYAPTLSELIEACGDKFGGLLKENNIFLVDLINGEWTAYDNQPSVTRDIYNGKSPEEAIARLWLKLNKK